MIEINIPGYKNFRFEHLVLDFNGTLAFDGRLIDGVNQDLLGMSNHLHIHVLTADTFGSVKAELWGIPCDVSILAEDRQELGKLAVLERLGPETCVSIGNGRNDRLMLGASALGIAVVQQEGAALETLFATFRS